MYVHHANRLSAQRLVRDLKWRVDKDTLTHTRVISKVEMTGVSKKENIVWLKKRENKNAIFICKALSFTTCERQMNAFYG